MQQGGGSQSHPYSMGGSSSAPIDQSQPQPQPQQHQMVVEEASPISSRPPATASLDEFGHRPENFADMDDPDRGGGSGGGNRWPRQETLALLKIRAEMDATFRDATVKGPLWEDVSRKMAELGFKRNAKKCKEKFENVDKYYKRTKEGRAGRQDGKTYKFFTELEALHTASSSAANPPPLFAPTSNNLIGIGFSSPTPISSVRPLPPSTSSGPTMQQHVFPATVAPPALSPGDLEFSSDGSSSSPETEEDEDNDEGTDLEAPESSRKRKREGSGGGSKKMMEFFEGLVKQVMQKQELMQQKFLEAIEKREQERMIREEAWRRQEIARLAREHEITAQERSISASRDATILSFLQKVTGQTVHLPPLPTATASPSLFPPPAPIHVAMPPQPHPYPRPQPPPQTTALAVVPEQQVRVHDSGEGPSSSRWPKVEVLALIRLRSELEARYQEAGPKGPLWEEISAGMNQLGYKRNPKRCKEKWENINKYFKKVKESNKKRPEDAKTCPYFHELDALYRKKIIGGSGGGSSGSIAGEGGVSQLQSTVDAPTTTVVIGASSASGDQGSNGGDKKPEDTVKQQHQQLGLMINPQGLNRHQNLTLNFSSHGVIPGQAPNNGGIVDDHDDDAMDEDEEYDDEDEDEEELEEERKMGYKIEFQQRQNNKPGPANGGGSGAPATFLAMVQ